MKKVKKLKLKKDVVANLEAEEMANLKGGTYLWGSRVTCTTNWNSGGCGASKSCSSIVCIPV